MRRSNTCGRPVIVQTIDITRDLNTNTHKKHWGYCVGVILWNWKIALGILATSESNITFSLSTKIRSLYVPLHATHQIMLGLGNFIHARLHRKTLQSQNNKYMSITRLLRKTTSFHDRLTLWLDLGVPRASLTRVPDKTRQDSGEFCHQRGPTSRVYSTEYPGVPMVTQHHVAI